MSLSNLMEYFFCKYKKIRPKTKIYLKYHKFSTLDENFTEIAKNFGYG